MTTTGMGPLTAGDLLTLYGQGVRGELIRGELCETKPAGHEHGKVVVRLVGELRAFAEPRRLGTLVASDSGIWLERDPDTVREPDIAFTSVQRLPLDAQITGYAEAIPDLVVEIGPPEGSHRPVHDKARMWLSHGVRLVWVVHPRTRTVDVHRPDRAVSTLGRGDTLDGMDVLPGFSCALSVVFGDRSEGAAEGAGSI